MAINEQLHIRIEPEVQRSFKAWCSKHGKSMTEICLLLINAVLQGLIDIDELQEAQDERGS